MIEDILAKLEKVRRTGPNNWIACCPAHDDSSPSLTIRAENDGRILVHCHSGCGFEAIKDAVGLGWDAWFPPKPQTDFVPSVRRPFPAADVLESLEFECVVVAVSAADLAEGKPLSERDKARLWLAFERVQTARRLALGER